MPLPPAALVVAKITSPPLTTNNGYRPLASCRRLTNCSSNQPPPRPNTAPMEKSRIKCSPNCQLTLWPGLARISISDTVRNTAIGSLLPDSISSVAVTRWFRPRPPSRLNTAAASVEPTIAPISMPSSRLRLNSQAATKPVSPAVTSTPRVANDSDGHNATRKLSTRVRMPPSSRMIASARLPTR